MNYTENLLIKRIRERVKDPMRFVDLPDTINKADFYKVPPPVSLSELEVAEKKLGFELPSLLRLLYLQIGNGGFGPGYGLIGVLATLLIHWGNKGFQCEIRRVRGSF